MEEKRQPGTKPLRTASNKIKDLYNTYMKNDEGRTIPIHSGDKGMEEEIEKNEAINDESGSISDDSVNLFSEEEVADMLKKIEELAKERDEAKEMMLRNAAEMENFRRRTMKEKQEIVEYANERLLYKMLEIIDNLGGAIDAGKKSSDYASLLTGIEMISAKTIKLFEEAGVKRMEDAAGKEFDVDYMDALMIAPSDSPEGTVLQVVSPGYMINEKVLRHAKVVTSSGPANAAEEEK
jgi:molecular chaperone GrpE